MNSLEKKDATISAHDTGKQERVKISELVGRLKKEMQRFLKSRYTVQQGLTTLSAILYN